jgi:hypothetical protein
MKRDHAERIIDATKRIDAILGEMYDILQEMEDGPEWRMLRRGIGELVIELYTKITREVAMEFPDLHPDKEDLERQKQEKKE